MDKPIYRLLYRSRPTPKVLERLDSETDSILTSSIFRNHQAKLTGILLFAKGHFMEALEGNEIEVRSTYGRIALDRRHRDLCVISQGFVPHRLFAGWAMCAANLTPSDGRIVNSLWSRADFCPEKMNAECGERLLVAVAELQRRAANELWI